MSVRQDGPSKKPRKGNERPPPPLFTSRTLSVVVASGVVGVLALESPRAGGAIAAVLAALLAFHKLTGE